MTGQKTESEKSFYELRYLRWFAVVCVIVLLLPWLAGTISTPAGSTYLGYQYNFDDHMVYAAWMRQAMDGHFLFDNRFAVDPQPGLTIHVYFFLLGLIAKIVSIPIATTLARAGFSALFLFLLYRLVRKLMPDVYATKLALALTVFGGGLGYLVWHNFGEEILRPEAMPYSGIMLGRLPTDVWQPEGYVFSSMLTNSLFMVSLCLILGAFLCVIEARNSAKAVLPGALCMAVLMNIHSYDVLLVTFALIGFLIAAFAQGLVTRDWVLRALGIGAGALLPALWFVYVLKNDTVFQARAATETFSPNFRQVFFGYLPMIVLAFVALVKRAPNEPEKSKRWFIGVGGLGVLLLGMFLEAANAGSKYWMGMGPWIGITLAGYACIYLLSTEDPVWNILVSWAVVGMTAPYFPALFQRKLAMGLSIPWAILATLGVVSLVQGRDRGSRNLITVLGIMLLCGSSVRWLFREFQFISSNVSNTTMHAIYLGADGKKILDYLNANKGPHTVVLAMPGFQSKAYDQEQKVIPDIFFTPFLTDLNPVMSGLAGVYTYAGHWSETPDYLRRRSLASTFFLKQITVKGQAVAMNDDRRRQILAETGANYVIAPVPTTFKFLELADVSTMGEIVVSGTQFQLIKVK